MTSSSRLYDVILTDVDAVVEGDLFSIRASSNKRMMFFTDEETFDARGGGGGGDFWGVQTTCWTAPGLIKLVSSLSTSTYDENDQVKVLI